MSEEAVKAPIRVLVVDDSADFGRLLEMLLRIERDFECVGVLESADELVPQALARQARVVVLDLTMPGRDPLDALTELVGKTDAVHVLVHSGYDDPEVRARARQAGARGLVSKQHEPTRLMEAIRRVARGESLFDG